jgi:hypothetical protein
LPRRTARYAATTLASRFNGIRASQMKINPKNVVISPRALTLLDKRVPFEGHVSNANNMHLVPALVYYLDMIYHDSNGDRVTTGPDTCFVGTIESLSKDM